MIKYTHLKWVFWISYDYENRPFKDGNGRIARLLINAALIQSGYLLDVIPPILRYEYIKLLENAHINDKPFEQFIAERVIESEKKIMRLLHIPIPQTQVEE